ncbi:MAG: hypothetical protein Q9202_000861 [Teloschistes flavicans]
MADLSSLLNPAPNTDPIQNEVSTPNQKGHRARPKPAQLPAVETATPPVQPSIKSPLDTLADAATSSGPILSPTNSNLFVNIGTYNQPTPQPSSRPSSSHFSPPPLSYDQPHPPAPTSPTFSSGLQQYHHPTSSEIRARRASTATENQLDSLPPLRRSLPNDSFANSESTDTQPHHAPSATSSLPAVDAATSIRQDQPIQNHGQDAHITQPSPEPSVTAEQQELESTQPSQDKVKTEINEIAPDLTAASPQPSAHSIEASTEPKQEFDSIKADEELKAAPSPALSHDSAQSAMAKPKAKPNRKRPAPKKGTATAVRPAAKKRKLEPSEGVIDASSLARIPSPASRRASKTPAPKNRKEESATPQRSSSIAAEDAEDDEDGVFCICRKPDDHTWMIGCDGPCEDWFHGRCINMTEKDGELIEKYFCPNCTEAGKGETLWKRMCRLDGCSRPARTSGAKPSKYCSDEHGSEFMRKKALEQEPEKDAGKNPENQAATPAPTKGRKTNNSLQDVTMNDAQLTSPPQIEPVQAPAPKEGDEADSDETQAQLRDGVLRPKELKALVTDVKDVSEFHRLGNVPLSPHTETNPEDPHNSNNSNQVPYTPLESSLLATLTTKKDALRDRKKFLDDRETVLTLVRERAKLVLEDMKKKESIKDICGFDNRLVWTDEEFNAWRTSPEGVKALEERKLGPPAPVPAPQDPAPHPPNQQNPTNGTGAVNGAAAAAAAPPPSASDEFAAGVCQKKRCERHRTWVKLQQQELAFARDEARQAIRKVEAEEKDIREKAMMRWLEGKPAAAGADEAGDDAGVQAKDSGEEGEGGKVEEMEKQAEEEGKVNGT